MTQERGEVTGGIWAAKSKPRTANFIAYGDELTYWQPDENDALDQWSVEIDLRHPGYLE